VLRVGVIGAGRRSAVVTQLVALGASPGADVRGSLDEPGVAIHDLGSDGNDLQPLMHMVVRIEPELHGSGRPDRDADVTIGGDEHDRECATETLWRSRILPFEANVRLRTRAPRARWPALTDAHSSWTADAARLVPRLRCGIGDHALRIDHIGSTSIPALPAKDLVDIQVVVRNLAAAHAAAARAREAGFVPVDGDWYGEDRSGVHHPEAVAVDADPGRPVNVNFRPVAAPVWREALLFRDWLRHHYDERDAYAAMKRTLVADKLHVDRYSEDKMPWIRAALGRAESWAATCGWSPGQPD
jgi:dephospho-CoA kinase